MIFVRFTVPSSAVRKLAPLLFMLSNTFWSVVVLAVAVVLITIFHWLSIKSLDV